MKTALKQTFLDRFGESEQPLQTYFSPGRVNLMGEHIDYNGGQVMPIALSLGIRAVLRPTTDGLIRIQSMQGEGELVIDMETEGFAKRPIAWMNYPLSVVYVLWKRQQTLQRRLRVFEQGFEMLIDSNLPMESGLSSSAALEVLMAYVLLNQSYKQVLENEESSLRLTIALLCQKAENNFVGVKSGIMDQFTVAMGKQKQAILLDCDLLSYQYVPFKTRNYTLLIMNTNKSRALSKSDYNTRRAECEEALADIRSRRNIKNLCDAELKELDYIANPTVQQRARHVITENQRVFAAAKALIEGNMPRFGDLLNQSHKSLRYDYEVTGFELDILTDIARQIPGCVGARMTGAGFGGCAIALVENDQVDDFKITVAQDYTELTGLKLSIYEADAGDGVREINV